MSEQEVIDLMKSSKSWAEWNANCDRVKKECGGYPPFWYSAIVESGISEDVAVLIRDSAQIQVHTFGEADK